MNVPYLSYIHGSSPVARLSSESQATQVHSAAVCECSNRARVSRSLVRPYGLGLQLARTDSYHAPTHLTTYTTTHTHTRTHTYHTHTHTHTHIPHTRTHTHTTHTRTHTHTHTQIEESAKKSVESATGSAALKLYNRWHEKLEEGESEGVQGEEEHKKKKSSRSEVWCVYGQGLIYSQIAAVSILEDQIFLVSSPDPTLSRGETVWQTKSNFLG